MGEGPGLGRQAAYFWWREKGASLGLSTIRDGHSNYVDSMLGV